MKPVGKLRRRPGQSAFRPPLIQIKVRRWREGAGCPGLKGLLHAPSVFVDRTAQGHDLPIRRPCSSWPAGRRLPGAARAINRLEQVADDLPSRIDRQDCLILSRIGPMLNSTALEETEIFPVLLEWPALHRRTARDHRAAEARASGRCLLCRGCRICCMDWAKAVRISRRMLRGTCCAGFCGSLRRHVARELQLVVPLIELVLPADTRQPHKSRSRSTSPTMTWRLLWMSMTPICLSLVICRGVRSRW